MTRVLWVAVADARGHLMRAHRARRLLAPAVNVDVVTTSDAGVAFLAALGTPSRLFGRGYALAFDEHQHFRPARTRARLMRYLALHAVGDVRRLTAWADDYDLIVDDALHPATLIASLCFDARAVPIVHVFGTTLLHAVLAAAGARGAAATLRSARRLPPTVAPSGGSRATAAQRAPSAGRASPTVAPSGGSRTTRSSRTNSSRPTSSCRRRASRR